MRDEFLSPQVNYRYQRRETQKTYFKIRFGNNFYI
jgi:hypothetical protein